MDVRLYQTPDGGEIEIVAGQPTMTEGLDTAVYLSLFGGSEIDSGLQGDARRQWWGNLAEPDPARRYRSETQHLVESLPAISANLRRLEDAALRDIAWMIDGGIAQGATCVVRMPALNTVSIHLELLVNGQIFPVDFLKPWTKA